MVHSLTEHYAAGELRRASGTDKSCKIKYQDSRTGQGKETDKTGWKHMTEHMNYSVPTWVTDTR